MNRRPASTSETGPGSTDEFDTAVDGDVLGEQLDAGVSGQAGASVDTLYDRMPDRPTADDAEDAELDEPVPNAERLVGEAVALVGDDHAQAHAGRPVLAVRARRGAGRLHRRRRWSRPPAATASWPSNGCPAS